MLVDADQLDTSPPEWLVDGIIPRVGCGFWYGPRYTGKSLVTDVELALAVANGTSFFGRKSMQGTVIVGLGEGLYDAGLRKQARLIREQDDRLKMAAQIAADHDDDVARQWLDAQPPYVDSNLKYLTEPFTLPVMRRDGEGEITASTRAFIHRAKKYHDLELVILDSVSDFTGGLSISNDTSANRLMLGVKELVRQLNCFVLMIAHPTERGDKMLGAGRLGNASDLIARSMPENAKTTDGQDVSTVTCEKNKYGKRFDPITYTVDDGTWWNEPIYDENGDDTGETYLANAPTIRLLDIADDESILRPKYKNRPLPTPVEPPDTQPRKRNGLVRIK